MEPQQIVFMLMGWVLFVVTAIFLSWREFMNSKMITSLIDRLQTRNLWEYKRSIEQDVKRQLRTTQHMTDAMMFDGEQKKLKKKSKELA